MPPRYIFPVNEPNPKGGLVYGQDPSQVCLLLPHHLPPTIAPYTNCLELQGPISIGPVVPCEPDAGNDLAPFRYGGPRKNHAKHIAASHLVQRMPKNRVYTLCPPERE